jgi:hypothetical protein
MVDFERLRKSALEAAAVGLGTVQEVAGRAAGLAQEAAAKVGLGKEGEGVDADDAKTLLREVILAQDAVAALAGKSAEELAPAVDRLNAASVRARDYLGLPPPPVPISPSGAEAETEANLS